jgi:hypothetical protein
MTFEKFIYKKQWNVSPKISKFKRINPCQKKDAKPSCETVPLHFSQASQGILRGTVANCFRDIGTHCRDLDRNGIIYHCARTD